VRRRVAAAFELSYRRLNETSARVFRLLPVNPGPDISTAAVCSPQSLASSSVAVRPACAVRRRKSASSWSSASPYSAQIWSIEVFIPE
jgi:hypothetical protein